MPWRDDKVELRRLLVSAVGEGRRDISGLCREFGISRTCGYKWLRRYAAEGASGLLDRSRRPHRVCGGTSEAVEALIVEDRGRHPAWGARKLRRRLEGKVLEVPSERTVNRILSRHGLVSGARRGESDLVTRFERSHPNDLWQIDHKGAYHGRWGVRAVPLSVLDDCSRYLIGLRSLGDKGLASTWGALWDLLGEFGLPDSVLTDNDQVFRGEAGPSRVEANFLRLGIAVLHGRPYHPQTQGKVERFHGTLVREVMIPRSFKSFGDLQELFDRFREEYNYSRPHEALGLSTPGSRYVPSVRCRPGVLPEMEYGGGAVLRKVNAWGRISLRKRQLAVGRGLCGERVEVRETVSGVDIYYGRYHILHFGLEEMFGGWKS